MNVEEIRYLAKMETLAQILYTNSCKITELSNTVSTIVDSYTGGEVRKVIKDKAISEMVNKCTECLDQVVEEIMSAIKDDLIALALADTIIATSYSNLLKKMSNKISEEIQEKIGSYHIDR